MCPAPRPVHCPARRCANYAVHPQPNHPPPSGWHPRNARAGCISKAVGATGQALCALEGADATPFDAQNTITFVGCIEGGQLQTSPECLAALTTHFDAAGCGIVCFQDFFGQGRRGQECALEATQEDCEATVVPCDSTATPTNGTATAPPPSTNVTAPVAPVPMASPGTNTSTAGTGADRPAHSAYTRMNSKSGDRTCGRGRGLSHDGRENASAALESLGTLL